MSKELAQLLFPNVDKTIEYYEELYPERNLDKKAKVTRLGLVQQALYTWVIFMVLL